MSPAASLPLLPVLSPIRQALGRPPRSRSSPVLQSTSQPVRRWREPGDSTWPSTRRRRFPAMAAGLVVSCGSPGGERFSTGSLWSRRVTPSPVARQKAVRAAGPPTRASSRLAQVLSLYSTAAWHISATDIAPRARFRRATGAYQSGRSAGPKDMICSSLSWPRSTRHRTRAAREALKLLHMTNRSSARQAILAPVARFSAWTPIRPPVSRS